MADPSLSVLQALAAVETAEAALATAKAALLAVADGGRHEQADLVTLKEAEKEFPRSNRQLRRYVKELGLVTTGDDGRLLASRRQSDSISTGASDGASPIVKVTARATERTITRMFHFPKTRSSVPRRWRCCGRGAHHGLHCLRSASGQWGARPNLSRASSGVNVASAKH